MKNQNGRPRKRLSVNQGYTYIYIQYINIYIQYITVYNQSRLLRNGVATQDIHLFLQAIDPQRLTGDDGGGYCTTLVHAGVNTSSVAL